MAEPLCCRTFIFHNPSVYSLTLVATSPYRGDITVCVVLTIAVIANFYMLPERELASPKAMTEGCATIYYLLWCSANFLACPFGEGAERSEAEGGCVLRN